MPVFRLLKIERRLITQPYGFESVSVTFSSLRTIESPNAESALSAGKKLYPRIALDLAIEG